MAIRTTLNVSLTTELGMFIQREIDSGRYRTASEVVRAALRLLDEHNRSFDDRPSPRKRAGVGGAS